MNIFISISFDVRYNSNKREVINSTSKSFRMSRTSNHSRLLLKQPTNNLYNDNELDPIKLKQLVKEMEKEQKEFRKVNQHLLSNIESIYQANDSLKAAIFERKINYEQLLDKYSNSITTLENSKNHNKKMTKIFHSYKTRARKLQQLSSNQINSYTEILKFQQEIDDIEESVILIMNKFPKRQKKAHRYQILLSILSKLMRINELFSKEAQNLINSNPSLLNQSNSTQIDKLDQIINQCDEVKSELPLTDNDEEQLELPEKAIKRLSRKLKKCIPFYNQILLIGERKNLLNEADAESLFDLSFSTSTSPLISPKDNIDHNINFESTYKNNSIKNLSISTTNSPLISPKSEYENPINFEATDKNNSFNNLSISTSVSPLFSPINSPKGKYKNLTNFEIIDDNVTLEEEIEELRKIVENDSFEYLDDPKVNELKEELQFLFDLFHRPNNNTNQNYEDSKKNKNSEDDTNSVKLSKSEKFLLNSKHDNSDEKSDTDHLVNLDNLDDAKNSLKTLNSEKADNSEGSMKKGENLSDNSKKSSKSKENQSGNAENSKDNNLNSENSTKSKNKDNLLDSENSTKNKDNLLNSECSSKSRNQDNEDDSARSSKSKASNKSSRTQNTDKTLNSDNEEDGIESSKNRPLSIDQINSLLPGQQEAVPQMPDQSEKRHRSHRHFHSKSKKVTLVNEKTNTGYTMEMIKERMKEERMRIEFARNSKSKYDPSIFYNSKDSPKRSNNSKKLDHIIKLTVTLKDIGLEGLDSSTPDKTQELKRFEKEKLKQDPKRQKKH